jgi:transposase
MKGGETVGSLPGERGRRRGRPPTLITVDPSDRRVLERQAAAATTTQRDALRARIVIGAAEGHSNVLIAERLGISTDTVSCWRRRFARSGLDGLHDQPRSGRPPTFTPVQRCEMIAAACEPAPLRDGLHGWTLDRLREHIRMLAIAKISRSHLHATLQRADLRPHKKRVWLHSKDPCFREKVTEIVDLYLHPQEGATVVCIDEKPGMQATQRKHEDRPASPGKDAKREFEYIRHGTQTLLAAFVVHTGAVITRCGPTRTGDDLEAFLEVVAKEIPGVVDVVWDNLNIHHGERWERFNAKHQSRFRFHYTPLHASWVNQVELWFGVLQRRSLANASFRSVEELRTAVAAFVAYWNREAKHPFRWSLTGYGRASTAPSIGEDHPWRRAI